MKLFVIRLIEETVDCDIAPKANKNIHKGWNEVLNYTNRALCGRRGREISSVCVGGCLERDFSVCLYVAKKLFLSVS